LSFSSSPPNRWIGYPNGYFGQMTSLCPITGPHDPYMSEKPFSRAIRIYHTTPHLSLTQKKLLKDYWKNGGRGQLPPPHVFGHIGVDSWVTAMHCCSPSPMHLTFCSLLPLFLHPSCLHYLRSCWSCRCRHAHHRMDSNRGCRSFHPSIALLHWSLGTHPVKDVGSLWYI